MSRIFGAPRQIGYVVDDLDGAIDRWVRLGVGPFFRIDGLKSKVFRVRGEDVELNLNVAVAVSGDMQIELIHQTDDTPTPYRDFLLRHGPGLQHLAVWSDDYDAHTQRLRDAGFTSIIEGEVAIDEANAVRYSYYEPGFEGATMMEIVDASPFFVAMNDMIRQTSLDWDGSDPVRRI